MWDDNDKRYLSPDEDRRIRKFVTKRLRLTLLFGNKSRQELQHPLTPTYEAQLRRAMGSTPEEFERIIAREDEPGRNQYAVRGT